MDRGRYWDAGDNVGVGGGVNGHAAQDGGRRHQREKLMLFFFPLIKKKNVETSAPPTRGSWQNMHLALNAKCARVASDILQTAVGGQKKNEKNTMNFRKNGWKWPRAAASERHFHPFIAHVIAHSHPPGRQFIDGQIVGDVLRLKGFFQSWARSLKRWEEKKKRKLNSYSLKVFFFSFALVGQRASEMWFKGHCFENTDQAGTFYD